MESSVRGRVPQVRILDTFDITNIVSDFIFGNFIFKISKI